MPDKKKKKTKGYRESTPKSRLVKAYKAVENSPVGWLVPGMAVKKIKKKLGYKKGGIIQHD